MDDTALDIVEETPDRLVLERPLERSEVVVAGIVAVASVGFLVALLAIAWTSGSVTPLVGAGLLVVLQVWLATRPSRASLDRATNRLVLTRPFAFRRVRLDRFTLEVDTDRFEGGVRGLLRLGGAVLALGPLRPTADEARQAIAPDAERVRRYLPGEPASDADA